jgi:hypothetical protein
MLSYPAPKFVWAAPIPTDLSLQDPDKDRPPPAPAEFDCMPDAPPSLLSASVRPMPPYAEVFEGGRIVEAVSEQEERNIIPYMIGAMIAFSVAVAYIAQKIF